MNSIAFAATLSILSAVEGLAPLKVTPGLGTAPISTRIPMLASLDLTRVTPVIAPLGASDYAVSIAPLRGDRGPVVGTRDGLAVLEAPLVTGDDWVVTLLLSLPGQNRHELTGSWPLPALRKQPLTATLGGRAWIVSVMGDPDTGVRFEANDQPLAGLQLPLSGLKRAVWNAAAPVPALGPDWRFAFNVDLWRGAGMRSFVFMRRNADGKVDYFRTGAEAVDSNRMVPRRVGGLLIGLRLDETGALVITRLP